MDLDLQGKAVVVAGGSRGIGFACAEAAASEGATVALIARDEEALAQAVERLRGLDRAGEVIGVASDLTDGPRVAAALDSIRSQIGEPDALVNCVGSAPPGGIDDLNDEAWQSAIDGKLMVAIRLSRELLPAMRRRGSGTLVHIAGLAGIEPQPGALTLGVVNAGVLNLTRALARETARDGVRVNAVLPGPTRTARFERLQRARAEREGRSYEDVVEAISRNIPSGRPSEPEDVAALVTFLISDRASQLNGAALAVDGGQVAGVR